MSAPTTAPTLTDGVVTLRAPRVDDVPRMVEQCRDPESARWTRVPAPYTEQDAVAFIADLVPQWWATGEQWALAVEHEGRFAGTIALRDEGEGVLEVAFGAHPDVRGRGVMERGLRLLLEWGFAERGARTVVWRAFVGNWGSRRLAWRLGFRVEGRLRRLLPHRGELRDAWVGTLLAGDPREPAEPWLDNPVVEGEGLRLRPFTGADVPRVVEGIGDEQTQYWLSFLPRHPGEAEGRAYLERVTERLATGHSITWAVADAEDDRLLGVVGIYRMTEGAELGYWTHPEARGTGLATAAARLALDHAFGALGLRTLAAYASVPNRASHRVLARLGFRPAGVLRDAATLGDGTRVDLGVYDLLSTEWAGRSDQNATASTTNPASESATPTTSGER